MPHKRILLFLLLSLALLGNCKRSGTPDFDYRAELWADQAGYYIYLPALFIYGMDASRVPEGTEEKLGCGYYAQGDKFFTKYPLGVALLQSPFFLLVHTAVGWQGGLSDGFSGWYQYVPNLAAIFYAALGAWFYFRFLLLRNISRRLSWLSTLVVVFGSHLLYYSVYFTGMSHVYSFFLISCFLWLAQRSLNRGKGSIAAYLGLGALGGALLITRPTNIILLTAVLLFFAFDQRQRFYQLLWHKRLLAGLLAGLLVVSLQMLYWYSVSGNFIYYSYQGEGFSNWQQPYLLEVWLAPNNGLLPYTPMFLLVLLALAWQFKMDYQKGILFLLCLVGLSYLVASWHIYHFGISFGSRNFVEYVPFFFLPLAEMLQQWKGGRKYIYSLALALLFVAFNLKFTYTFDLMFGGNNWDWGQYRELALRGGRYASHSFGTIASQAAPKPYKIDDMNSRWVTGSDLRSLDIWGEARLFEIVGKPHLVVAIADKDSLYFWQGRALEELLGNSDMAGKFYTRYNLPAGVPPGADLKIMAWKEDGDSLAINDLWMEFK